MGRWSTRLGELDQRVLHGDHWLGRQHKRLALRQRRQLDWTARHHVLIVVLSLLGLTLIVAFGRR